MLLFCTKNRDLELFYLDLAGALARPPAVPAVYALVSFEGAAPRYYIGSSRRLTARLGAHLSFARSRKLRGHSAGGRLLASVVARRQRVLVVILETCAGATTAALQRREQAWLMAATRDCGAAALPYQVPAPRVSARGPHAPATLAVRRQWPTAWVDALAPFFREPRALVQVHPALRHAANGAAKGARGDKARDERGKTGPEARR